MPTVALALAAIAGLLHAYFFLLESVLWRRPMAHRTFGVKDPAEVEVLAFSMLNQGVYNLFLAVGTLVGVVGTFRGWEPQGPTLVVFCLLCMVAAAVVLLVARPKMQRGALVQGLLPLIALAIAALA